ncbi:MAG: formylglycine-generating enzyme family protein [Anaerolineae bacterium]|nr:formylglycine-generating enzyme family protein [Anaerolineae bacterium]
MSLPRGLFNELVDFLKPHVGNDADERRALLMLAFGTDSSILSKIKYDYPERTFVPHLVEKLDNYGKVGGEPALCVLLRTVKKEVGENEQERVNELLRDLGYALKSRADDKAPPLKTPPPPDLSEESPYKKLLLGIGAIAIVAIVVIVVIAIASQPPSPPAPTPTQTPTGTVMDTPVPTGTVTDTPTDTPTDAATNTPTYTPSATDAPTLANTPTATPPAPTPVALLPETVAALLLTQTADAWTDTPTPTPTPTDTPTSTDTPTPTDNYTQTIEAAWTQIAKTLSAEQTATATLWTPTPTPTPTATPYAPGDIPDWTPQETAINGVTFVYVPAGCFMMGSEDDYDDERPMREVCLDAYWIGKTEVTNAQYKACVDAGACTPSVDRERHDDPEYADYPVVYVSWFQAQTYTEWLGVSLPTEAQWEYAARGPAGNVYPWGDEAPTCDLANYYGCVDDTTPVGSYPGGASWVGALDMSGNVWEWAADWYGAYPEDDQLNPTGPADGSARVARGGSFGNGRWFVRAAVRSADTPVILYNYWGFRAAAPASLAE